RTSLAGFIERPQADQANRRNTKYRVVILTLTTNNKAKLALLSKKPYPRQAVLRSTANYTSHRNEGFSCCANRTTATSHYCRPHIPADLTLLQTSSTIALKHSMTSCCVLKTIGF
ncbi:MAG TPA: hypothetical protein VK032_08580, partial [Burkholderiaceae bacterium]|nr:hypothetical protein [Burkholderiaceae bacterium]